MSKYFSGVHFYKEVGFLTVGLKHGTFMKTMEATASQLDVKMEYFDIPSLQRRYPYLWFESYNECILTPQNGGCINPRKLVEAQRILASKAGCHLVDDVVAKIDSKETPFKHMVITTDKQKVFLTKRVLLATGAFTKCRRLLPPQLQPDFTILTQTVVRVRMI